jgi:hypothetical protein
MSHRIKQNPFAPHVPQKPHHRHGDDHRGHGRGHGHDCRPEPSCEPRRPRRGHC